MIKKIYEKIKITFKNMEEKNIKLIKLGLKFSLVIAIIATCILFTYLFFIHSVIIYQIGILVLQLSLYFAADFIVSGIAVDSIKKQMI